MTYIGLWAHAIIAKRCFLEKTQKNEIFRSSLQEGLDSNPTQPTFTLTVGTLSHKNPRAEKGRKNE